MKLLISTFIAMLSLSLSAQEKKENANFANWVVESNVKTPKNAIVKFYNANQELVYQEAVVGRKIKIERAKVREGLNQILKQIIQDKKPSSDVVMAFLKNTSSIF
ncbi:hypothetical protein [Pedobacter sp. Hv1]|uniref:hypothetical protein n=1 Tax=Pedobacter sp. Hv1 TaxID=1740090 RepID=UPI00128ECB53|nr:hypothetical protein [Pedobacter sp. Hv1]